MRLSRHGLLKVTVAATLAVVVGAAASACGSSNSGAGGDQSVTVYNAQHEDLTQAEADAFTAQTGIKVTMRNGDDSEQSNQLVQEGSASPADVFLTENSPGMGLVASKGLLAPIDQATRIQVPAQYSPADGSWVGWAARSTVLAYNTSKLTPAQLPASIIDLAQPQWKGKIGISPSGADFQAIVSAVVQLKGEDATLTWLKGLKSNAKIYQGNTSVMKAV
ncbi:MAG: extracellular solute-binding protein, partial [Mycobacteriaceae bacterium]